MALTARDLAREVRALAQASEEAQNMTQMQRYVDNLDSMIAALRVALDEASEASRWHSSDLASEITALETNETLVPGTNYGKQQVIRLHALRAAFETFLADTVAGAGVTGTPTVEDVLYDVGVGIVAA